MFKRCQHQWEEVGRSFTEGVKTLGNAKGFPSGGEMLDFLQGLRAGQTHIELRCSLCGDVQSRTLEGIHRHNE